MDPLATLNLIVEALIAEEVAAVKRLEAVLSVVDAQYHRGARDMADKIAAKIRAAMVANPVQPLHGLPQTWPIVSEVNPEAMEA